VNGLLPLRPAPAPCPLAEYPARHPRPAVRVQQRGVQRAGCHYPAQPACTPAGRRARLAVKVSRAPAVLCRLRRRDRASSQLPAAALACTPIDAVRSERTRCGGRCVCRRAHWGRCVSSAPSAPLAPAPRAAVHNEEEEEIALSCSQRRGCMSACSGRVGAPDAACLRCGGLHLFGCEEDFFALPLWWAVGH
jgi:hypothetical protein